MRQTRWSWVRGAGLIGLLCLAPPALADSHAPDRAFLRGAYQKMDRAIGDRDAAGFVAFMRPDVVIVDKAGEAAPGGREGMRKEMSQAFAAAAAGGARITYHTTVTRISFGPQGATVTRRSDNTITGTVRGKKSALTSGVTDRDLWVRSGGVWQLKTSKVLAEH